MSRLSGELDRLAVDLDGITMVDDKFMVNSPGTTQSLMNSNDVIVSAASDILMHMFIGHK